MQLTYRIVEIRSFGILFLPVVSVAYCNKFLAGKDEVVSMSDQHHHVEHIRQISDSQG